MLRPDVVLTARHCFNTAQVPNTVVVRGGWNGTAWTESARGLAINKLRVNVASVGELNDWSFVAETPNTGGPASWSISGGSLNEASNIAGTGSPAGTGAEAILKNMTIANACVATNIRSSDDDSGGIIARYQDHDNYYRIFVDQSTQTVNFDEVRGGVSSRIASHASRSPTTRPFTSRIRSRRRAFSPRAARFEQREDRAHASNDVRAPPPSRDRHGRPRPAPSRDRAWPGGPTP